MYPNYALTSAQKGWKRAVFLIYEVGSSALTRLQIWQKVFVCLFDLIRLNKDQKSRVIGNFSHCYSTLKSKSCIETILNRGRNSNVNSQPDFKLVFGFRHSVNNLLTLFPDIH